MTFEAGIGAIVLPGYEQRLACSFTADRTLAAVLNGAFQTEA
jgi:hypothetical protein